MRQDVTIEIKAMLAAHQAAITTVMSNLAVNTADPHKAMAQMSEQAQHLISISQFEGPDAEAVRREAQGLIRHIVATVSFPRNGTPEG